MAARPYADHPAIAILWKSAHEFKIARAHRVVGERQQIARPGGFDSLMEFKISPLISVIPGKPTITVR
ncbi:hypothetical protein AGROH133_14940 (plasmid) [Agrobacterium tumefaciens]|jgi:hypothetical protein|nr:hypothetical protein AGROH133_14940 [Agrobacterium tumefaciens]